MPEVAEIDARTIVVGDVHRHVVNLAMVMADTTLGPKLYRRLRRLPFHPEVLLGAQERCGDWEASSHVNGMLCLPWAVDYFVACWMGRSANAGTTREFDGGLPVRWNANGGDSNTRYRAAVASLNAWRRILRRCNFVTMDCFDFLAKCDDEPGHGVYCDPPFPDCGAKYRHSFTTDQHRRLA